MAEVVYSTNHGYDEGSYIVEDGETYIVTEVINNNKYKREKSVQVPFINPNDEKYKTNKGDAIRFNQGKLRFDLVNPQAHKDMVEVLTHGAEKYFDRNWEKGFAWTSVLASLKRHIDAWERGEDYDPDSGLLHMAHAACNVHYLNAFYYLFPQGDDRPKPFMRGFKIGLDIDGVLADFMGGWHNEYPEINPNPSTYYLDKDLHEKVEILRNEGKLENFYLNLKPLISPDELPFEPHCYITSRFVGTAITKEWLHKNGFPNKEVYTINGKSKVEIAKESGINIFIEDFFENFVDLNNNGILTYLISRPWNMKYNVGHLRINNINDLPILK